MKFDRVYSPVVNTYYLYAEEYHTPHMYRLIHYTHDRMWIVDKTLDGADWVAGHAYLPSFWIFIEKVIDSGEA